METSALSDETYSLSATLLKMLMEFNCIGGVRSDDEESLTECGDLTLISNYPTINELMLNDPKKVKLTLNHPYNRQL